MTGASCSATPQQSPRYSIVCCITPTCSSADHGAGGRKCRPICARTRERSRTHWSRPLRKLPVLPCPLIAGFQPSNEGATPERRVHGSYGKPHRTRFPTGPTPIVSFTERRKDHEERSTQRNPPLNRIRPIPVIGPTCCATPSGTRWLQSGGDIFK